MTTRGSKKTIGSLVCVTLVLLGCSTSGGSSATEGTRRDRNLLTAAELEGMGELSVHDAIRRLRPAWLRYRGQAVLSGPDRESLRVYMNRSFFGDASSLSDVRVRDVSELRFLDARQATLRFGTDHTLGAILITSGGS